MSETSRKIRELIKECEKTPDHICEKTKCENCPLVKKSIKQWGVDVIYINANHR